MKQRTNPIHCVPKISQPASMMLILLMLGFVATSCGSHKRKDDGVQVIKVDLNDKQITKGIHITDIIPLETIECSLIGRVSKLFCWNNRIIVLDNSRSKSLFLFNEKGKFLFSTDKGKGPGEVLHPESVYLQKKDSTIILYDNYARIFYYYNTNGNFLRQKRMPGNINIVDFFPVSKDTMLVYSSTTIIEPGGNKKQATFSICTNNYADIKHLGLYLQFSKSQQNLYCPVAFISDKTFFVAPWRYAIYQLIGDEVKMRYSIDFGDAALTPYQMEYAPTTDIIPLVYDSPINKVGSLKTLFVNDKILVFYAEHGKTGLNIIYSLKEKKVYNLDNYYEKGILPWGKVWGLNDDGSLIMVVEPEDFLEFNKTCSNKYDYLGINSNSNPILVKFQFDKPF